MSTRIRAIVEGILVCALVIVVVGATIYLLPLLVARVTR